MRWVDYISTEPTLEPVCVEDFKSFVRIDHDDDDTQIERMLKAARQWCEDYQHRAYVTQTRVLKLDGFPCGAIDLMRAPLASVTSITYLDIAGSSQTWSNSRYQVDTVSIPPRILPIETETYPDTQAATFNTVTVTYVCGAAVASVSSRVKEAILRMTRSLYEGCDIDTAGGTVLSFLDSERVRWPS